MFDTFPYGVHVQGIDCAHGNVICNISLGTICPCFLYKYIQYFNYAHLFYVYATLQSDCLVLNSEPTCRFQNVPSDLEFSDIHGILDDTLGVID